MKFLQTFLVSFNFVGFAFLVMILSFIASAYTGQAQWFARSGSLLTVAGLTSSSRAVLRRHIMEDPFWGTLDATAEEIELREKKNQSDDLYAAKIGFVLAIMGTIVWGYGDLIPFRP